MVANTDPTVFTDEDSKDLKKAIGEAGQVTNYLEVGIPRLQALFNRLRAAELALDLATDRCRGMCQCGYLEAQDMWLQAAGKSE